MARHTDPIDVQLHKNGPYWLARWRDSNGERRSRSLGKRKDEGGDVSERQARRECAKIQNKMSLEPGRRDAAGNATLGWWCKRYMALRTDLAPETRKLHQTAIDYLLEFFEDGRRLDRITRADAADWRVWLTEQPKRPASGDEEAEPALLGEATVCKHTRTAKVMFKHALNEGHVGTNVFDHLVGTPPDRDKDWHDLSHQDVQRLIDAAPSPAWRAMIGLCAWGGLRRSEALAIEWEQVQWTAHRLVVYPPGGTVTTKKRRREVLLDGSLDRLLLEVHELAEPGEKRVAPISHNNLIRNLRRIITRAGLDQWPDPFHTFRRYRAQTWREDYPEAIVDAWLGHSLQVARKHYVKVPEQYYQTGPSEVDRLRGQLSRERRRVRRVLTLAKRLKTGTKRGTKAKK